MGSPEINQAPSLVDTKFRVIKDKRKPADILASGERVKRIEDIPLSHILTAEAIIDDSHASDLGNSIDVKGQNSPITVRIRPAVEGDLILGPKNEYQQAKEGDLVYDISDGYHRTIAKQRKKKPDKTIQASVMYGCTDEELIDDRILSASSIETVQIPRMASWLTKAFNQSPFGNKNIPVDIAFGYASGKKTQVGPVINNLTGDEKSNLKIWVNSKCNLWKKNPAEMHTILRLVRDADPELVNEITPKGPGIRKELLSRISYNFPREEFYPAQRIILDVIKTRKLKNKEITFLLAHLNIDKNMSPEMIREIAMTSDIEPKEEIIFQPNTKDLLVEKDNIIKKLKEERDTLKEERDRYKRNIAWWETTPNLTHDEKRVARANAYGELPRLIGDGTMSKESIGINLRSALEKLHNHRSSR